MDTVTSLRTLREAIYGGTDMGDVIDLIAGVDASLIKKAMAGDMDAAKIFHQRHALNLSTGPWQVHLCHNETYATVSYRKTTQTIGSNRNPELLSLAWVEATLALMLNNVQQEESSNG